MSKYKSNTNFATRLAQGSLVMLACVTVLQVVSWLPIRSDPHATVNRAHPTPNFAAAIRLPSTPIEKLSSDDEAAQREGARELSAQIEATWPDDHRRAFLVRVAPAAFESAIESCIPPSITLAQAIQESGWGRSGLATRHGNLFGVKTSAGGVVMNTEEVTAGERRAIQARFASFQDWEASVAHHNELLAKDPRYAPARERWDNWEQFLKALGPVYATDPKYVARVSRLVDDYELDRWDELVSRAAQKHAHCDSTP